MNFFDDNNQYAPELAVKMAKSSKETGEAQLTVDVFQDDEHIIIQSTIAGVSRDDIDIALTTDMVTIKGTRKRAESVGPSDYYHQELYWGPFSRSIILPTDIDPEGAKASLNNGILTIKLPKAGRLRTKRIKVSE